MAGPRVLDIMGHRVDLSRITNPALQRSIRDRIRYGEFLFAYGDHDQYAEKYDAYSESRKYKEWTEHVQSPWGDWGEGIGEWRRYRTTPHTEYYR